MFFSGKTVAQNSKLTLSGRVIERQRKRSIPFAIVVALKNNDSSFVSGMIPNELIDIWALLL
ncbi:MAG: hypothetical protein KBI42_13040 [Bacteroidia bacterium]|nr:hypothetical protein [Bacteroidia bacterium]